MKTQWTAMIGCLVLGLMLGVMGTLSFAQSGSMLETQVVSWEDARGNTGEWGEMRVYMSGETYGTSDAFAALAVVKPGESVHPAHRHAAEEYLVVTKGEGIWHVNGEEFPAREGDVLYVEPWDMHGLVNTGSEPLTFFVVKWNSKGVEKVPEPEGDHGR